jgi:uncharacterized protein
LTALPASDSIRDMSWITEQSGGVILVIHAAPRAARSQIQGLHGDALKVRLQAPPVDGKANETLMEFLAEVLGVPRRQVTLLSGLTSKHKRVAVQGINAQEVRTKLEIK